MSEPTHPDSRQNINVTGKSLEELKIGGIAGRDLNVNQAPINIINIFSPFSIDRLIKIDGLYEVPSKVEENQDRFRQQLLIRVQNICRDLLQKSLYEKVLIEFELVDKRNTIQKLLSYNDETCTESGQTLSKFLKKNDIFDQIGTGRTVLILGEPGAGKTITLIKLAQSLVELIDDGKFRYPIPVVLNLSSWAEKQLSISEWLVEELHDFYEIDKKVGKYWVNNQYLFLFFDGLDEVQEKCRSACVKVLKQFINEYKLTRIVVCCRAQEYQDLSRKIELYNIVFIQLLNLPQIKSYLAQVGDQLKALKILILEEESELQELAKTPLNLSVMSLAFQNFPLENLSELRLEEAWKDHLWDFYLKKMFERERAIQHCEIKQPYTKKQTMYYLVWLAKQMTESSQGIFLIERLQPSMLAQKWHPNRSQSSIWKAQLCYRFQSALIFGLFVGCFGMFSILPSGNLQALLAFGLLFGAVGALIGAMITGNLDDIKTIETLEWSIKKPLSKKFFFRELVLGLLFGLVSGLILWRVSNFKVDLILAIQLMSILGLFFAPLISFIVWMLSSLRGPVLKNTMQPNQGILKSAQNAAIVGSISAASGFLISGLFGLFNGGLENVLSYGFIGAIIYGLLGALTCGGSACLRYFNLRLTLRYLGYVPWNYTHFLNYATERIFMQRVGGGYTFVHGTLRKHLAEMELPKKLR